MEKWYTIIVVYFLKGEFKLLNFRKFLISALTGAIAVSTMAVLPASADSLDATAYLCFSGGSNDSWDESDEAPSVKVDGDGEYTVTYTPAEKLESNVKFLGVQFEGMPDIDSAYTVTAVSIKAGDKDVKIDDSYVNTYYAGIPQLKVIEDSKGVDISELDGASSISVTFSVKTGKADENADEAEVESTSSGEVTDNMTTDSSAPTLAFDSDDWSSYISALDTTESGAVSLKKEADVVYQGAAIKLTADITTAPDYSTDTDTEMGVVLEASSFGLDNFDGYTLNFYARFNTNVEGLLFEDSVYAFGENADGVMTSKTIKTIKFNQSSNVNGYEKQFVSIPSSSNTTRIIIKVPINAAYSGDVMYFDNITLITPLTDSDGNSYQIKSLDTYNSNAKVTNTGDVIKQNVKSKTLSGMDSTAESSSGGFNPMIIVIVVLVLVVIGVVVFVIIKQKNRYY